MNDVEICSEAYSVMYEFEYINVTPENHGNSFLDLFIILNVLWVSYMNEKERETKEKVDIIKEKKENERNYIKIISIDNLIHVFIIIHIFMSHVIWINHCSSN